MVLGHKIFTQIFSFPKISVNVGKNGATFALNYIVCTPNVLTEIQIISLLYHYVPSLIVNRTDLIPPPVTPIKFLHKP